MSDLKNDVTVLTSQWLERVNSTPECGNEKKYNLELVIDESSKLGGSESESRKPDLGFKLRGQCASSHIPILEIFLSNARGCTPNLAQLVIPTFL
jgi:hypothetical protein